MNLLTAFALGVVAGAVICLLVFWWFFGDLNLYK